MASKSLILYGVLALALAGTGGAALWAHAGPQTHASPMGTAFDHGDIERHMAQMARHLDEIGASAQQKARIEALLKGAEDDFGVVHEGMRQDHEALVAALMQEPVDRAALEQVRKSHLQMADVASQRKFALIADVAAVLTPEQRKALAERAKQHHAGKMHHGG